MDVGNFVFDINLLQGLLLWFVLNKPHSKIASRKHIRVGAISHFKQ